MDSKTFDALIKNMDTTRVTRLTALRGLAGGALAAVVGVAIATSETEAARKKAKKAKKAKKRSRRSTYVQPPLDYGTGPGPKPEKPNEPGPIVCGSYEECAYGQHWDDKDCRCTCNDKDYEVCKATDEYSHLRDTCVYAKCGEYRKYNPDTCDCEDVCYPPEYGCGTGNHWNYDDCVCEPDGGVPGTCPGTPGPRRNGSDCQDPEGSGEGNSNLCRSCCCVNRGASQRCASPDPSNPVCAS